MKLTDDIVKSMAMAKVFKDNVSVVFFFEVSFSHYFLQTNKINSIDFFNDGELMVSAGDDESVHVYNTNSGEYVFILISTVSLSFHLSNVLPSVSLPSLLPFPCSVSFLIVHSFVSSQNAEGCV